MSSTDSNQTNESQAGASSASVAPAATVSSLSVRDLRIAFGKKNPTEVVHGISLDLTAGRIQGLAGESGSGKTVSAMAILGLLPASATVAGSVKLADKELIGMRNRELNTVRGKKIAMVFQDPSASLHPQLSVGTQLCDHMRVHLKLSKKAARARAVELLDQVHVPEPVQALRRFPHQFSGGQRQRIAIAVALACEPDVLLADEPTTALDVTVQAGILHLLRDLVRQRDLAVLLVTHDLGVMSAVADDIAVMRYGQIVESGLTKDIFTAPKHPYTRQLLESMPDAQESKVEERQ